MALKTSVPTEGSGSTPPAAPPEPADTVLLELNLYTNYTWKGLAFQKGKAYRFSKNDAMQLLSEMDHERAVWRIYRPIKPKVAPKDVVVDARDIEVGVPDEPIHGLLPEKRIDVGTDDEIADILNRTDAGDVTV